jgi:Coenzyme PQQ synthesis protein D (PqqD).
MRLLDGFVLRSICNEHIVTGEGLARVDFSKVISLNPTAAYLWEQVQDRDFTAEDLVDLLTERYDVDRERARADVDKLLVSWREAGLMAE